jgi:hypothetical protein
MKRKLANSKLSYLLFFVAFSTFTNYCYSQTEKITFTIFLKNRDSIQCQGISFRETKLKDFQYWTEPNLQKTDSWSSTPLLNIRILEFGKAGSDVLNSYVEVKLTLFNDLVKKVYTSPTYQFYYPDKKLPTGENNISISEIKSIKFYR